MLTLIFGIWASEPPLGPGERMKRPGLIGLGLSAYRLQVFLVKYEYLRSLQLCEDQSILGKLKKRVRKHVLAIVTTYMETRL